MSKSGFEFVEFNFDAVWAALSKSTLLNNYFDKLATEVKNEATSKAKNEAKDDGFYSSLFKSKTISANQLRREFTDTYNERRNRSRRGTNNRIIDAPTVKGEDGKPVKLKGDPDGSEYSGAVGLVENYDYKAVWIEYGSIAKGPKFILSRSAEEVANQNDAEWEVLYSKTHQQNIPELKAKQAAGKAKVKRIREGK
jgi:hypothetical protein